jgi:hypothetical protein
LANPASPISSNGDFECVYIFVFLLDFRQTVFNAVYAGVEVVLERRTQSVNVLFVGKEFVRKLDLSHPVGFEVFFPILFDLFVEHIQRTLQVSLYEVKKGLSVFTLKIEPNRVSKAKRPSGSNHQLCYFN